ncbi:MAG: ATP-binding protein [Deltaproteobacteria bacterium]|nr:ATP-binding protein [Deltaproteobacteria bacterium]
MALMLTAEVPSTIASRDLLGGVVAGLCQTLAREHGIEGLDADVLTAFNEAFNNVVIHAYDGLAGQVHLELAVDEGSLVIKLLDSGRPFRLEDIQPPAFAGGDALAIDDLPEGGMGVYLMRAVMDDVCYVAASSHGDRNCLTMIKRFNQPTGNGAR